MCHPVRSRQLQIARLQTPNFSVITHTIINKSLNFFSLLLVRSLSETIQAVFSGRFYTRDVQCFLPHSSFPPHNRILFLYPFSSEAGGFFCGCIVTCFLAGFFFSSSFFKRLEANISLSAPTHLLEVSVFLLPTSVAIHSAGLLPFDVHSLKMGDEFSHFIFSSFDACRLRNISRLRTQRLTLDSWILHFTSVSENTCS